MLSHQQHHPVFTPQNVLSLLGKMLFQRCYSNVWLTFFAVNTKKHIFTYPIFVFTHFKSVYEKKDAAVDTTGIMISESCDV